ncbi:unnamed protein product [Schistocephalus solidus]|uniref:Reverse transcriptase domain-containing protein n=1 Tax=Schistocephalus solidus TaxID=70667 RepID=A0A183THW8_SCHSO|nr:unnamed protein product [Schistocephalus solidus]
MTAKSARGNRKKYWAEIATSMEQASNAPGEDGMPSEIYKSHVEKLVPWLHEVIAKAWGDEGVPDDWGSDILVPVRKKGYKTRYENYRGISLIDVAAKIFAIVLLRRFQVVRGSRTRPNQAGFHAGHGCVEYIQTILCVLWSVTRGIDIIGALALQTRSMGWYSPLNLFHPQPAMLAQMLSGAGVNACQIPPQVVIIGTSIGLKDIIDYPDILSSHVMTMRLQVNTLGLQLLDSRS